MRVKFKTKEEKSYTQVDFKLDGPIEPSELVNMDPPTVNLTKGVILSGRGPIWLYGTLIHYYHPAVWVATFDPRLDAAVVVESHIKYTNVGTLIK